MLTRRDATRRATRSWEGIEAQRAGVELNVFKLADANIPYGYRRERSSKTQLRYRCRPVAPPPGARLTRPSAQPGAGC